MYTAPFVCDTFFPLPPYTPPTPGTSCDHPFPARTPHKYFVLPRVCLPMTSSLGHILASLHSKVCVRNDGHRVPLDPRVMVVCPRQKFSPCPCLQEDLQSSCSGAGWRSLKESRMCTRPSQPAWKALSYGKSPEPALGVQRGCEECEGCRLGIWGSSGLLI